MYMLGRRAIVSRAAMGFFAENKDVRKRAHRHRLDCNKENIPRFSYYSALVNDLRYFPFSDMDDIYAAVGRELKVPILVLWGRLDDVVPCNLSSKVMEYLAPASPQLTVYEHGGHFPYWDDANRLSQTLLSFWQSKGV